MLVVKRLFFNYVFDIDRNTLISTNILFKRHFKPQTLNLVKRLTKNHQTERRNKSKVITFGHVHLIRNKN